MGRNSLCIQRVCDKIVMANDEEWTESQRSTSVFASYLERNRASAWVLVCGLPCSLFSWNMLPSSGITLPTAHDCGKSISFSVQGFQQRQWMSVIRDSLEGAYTGTHVILTLLWQKFKNKHIPFISQTWPGKNIHLRKMVIMPHEINQP